MAHIQFYYPKRLAFSPADFENPGLGGGESSIVLLSKSLANHGHYVEVFCACWNPGIYDGVVWRGAWEIYDSDIPDIMIHVRTKSSIIDRRAKQNIFWMLDDRADGAIYFSKKYPNQQVIVASDAMVRKLKNAGFVGKYTLINFPIETNRFENAPLPSASRLCLHTSMPNRGLLQLINLWPHVKKMVPDAQLSACRSNGLIIKVIINVFILLPQNLIAKQHYISAHQKPKRENEEYTPPNKQELALKKLRRIKRTAVSTVMMDLFFFKETVIHMSREHITICIEMF